MKKILNHLFDYKSLSREEAKNMLVRISQGIYNENEIASFITVFLMRSITIDELQGFRDALLELCIKIDLVDYDVMDIVGTGGDGKNTFNISTLSCFIVAGSGNKVAKHGNYGVSSISGSSNVMEHLGYVFKSDRGSLQKELEKANISFLHAPLFHPALKIVAPVRKNLGIRTFFNILGPIVNPCFPKYQVLGVYSLEMARTYNYLLQQCDHKYTIIHSLDGYDEISLTSHSKIITTKGDQIVSPEELSNKLVYPENLYGGESIDESASIFMNILKGEGTPEQNAVVLANAAVALQCLEKYADYKECYEIATESLVSGKALQALKKLIQI